MTPEELRNALAKGLVVVLAGPCTVSYEGRASSRLGEGERLVIIKRDRSVLVHRPEGYEPVNWQPANSKIDFTTSGEEFQIRVSNGPELLTITFTSPPRIEYFELRDTAVFEMYASEEDMKKAVIARPDLVEEGFKPFVEERPVRKTGRVDLLGVDRHGNILVVEFKKNSATAQDILQLKTYVESLQEEFGNRPRAVIAAPGLTKNARSMLDLHGIEFRCLTPRQCSQVLERMRNLDRYL
jgi:RecB family endonuclease NucS